MQIIDTHAHIYLPEFDGDRAQVIEAAAKEGVSAILLPAIDSSTHGAMLQLEKDYSGCRAMIGLHPCSVKEEYERELDIVNHYLQQRSFVAIGEIGLDFHWDKTFVDQQYDAFHRQVQIALEYRLPVVIHSRSATDECIEVVRQYPDIKGVFHCFSGTVEQAEALAGIGFLLGIGGVVTFKNANLDKVIEQIGMDHIVLETDAPYLTPVPFRGKRNESGYLRYIVHKLSSVLAKSPEEIAKITTQNAKKLFGLT